MISLRQSYETAVINPGPLSTGIRAWSKAGPDAFPFSSLRSLCNAFHWPSQFIYTEERPSEIRPPRGPEKSWDGVVQGIARDEHYWYLNTADALWYFEDPKWCSGNGPKSLLVGQEAIVETENNDILYRFGGRQQLVDTDAAQGPKHLSAPALFGKLLLVPAEGFPLPEEQVLWVWVFSTETLGYLGRFSVEVPAPYEIPWCAVSQDGRLMYTSGFGELSLAGGMIKISTVRSIFIHRLPDLRQFTIDPTTGLPVQPSNDMAINAHWDPYYQFDKSTLIGTLKIIDPGGAEAFGRVQGGCVSPNGHLYISFEKVRKQGEEEDCKGVLGIDLLTGKGVRYQDSDRGDEVEGVFVGTDGIHVLHNDDVAGNDFTISHYAADTADV